MPDPLKVDVAYTSDGRWVAEIEPDFDQPFEQNSLLGLVDSIRQARPEDDLIFIVDADSIQNQLIAETEFGDAVKRQGAAIQKSRKSFSGDVAGS